MRYQVLIEMKPGEKAEGCHVEDYRTKREANGRVKALKKEGRDASVWDTRDNAITRAFRL